MNSAFLRIKKSPPLRFRKRVPAAVVPSPSIADAGKALNDLVGKAVFFASGGERVAGKVARVEGKDLVVQLAVPSRDGLLFVSETEMTVKASDLDVTNALMQDRKLKTFEAGAALRLAEDRKAVPIQAGGDSKGPIVDYRGVTIEGYASTFGGPNDRDRGGDYIAPGAWDKTLQEFMRNPVLLTDHDNSVDALAGSWVKVSVDGKGLAVRGSISDAPSMCDLRFKLVEGHLKGLSIGGVWYYSQEDKGLIEEIDLYEISLVCVPMNAETLAYTRSLNEASCRKAFARYWRNHKSLRDPKDFQSSPKPHQ
jgi:HK97 family phage prohead protease